MEVKSKTEAMKERAFKFLKEKYQVKDNEIYFKEPDLPLKTSIDKITKYMAEFLSEEKEKEAVELAHKIGEAILKKQYEIYTPLRKLVVEVPEIIYEFDKEGVDILPKIDF